MKKFCLALVIPILLYQCAGLTPKEQSSIVNKEEKNIEINSSWSLYSKGLYHKSIDDYKTAIDYFIKAAAFEEDLARIYYQISECYYNTLDYESAVKYANLSIGRDKGLYKPYTLLYRVYLNLGEYQNAASSLEALLEIKPDLINIRYTVGMLYYNQLKNYDMALAAFNKIIEMETSENIDDYYREQAHYYLGRIYYNKGQVEKSIEQFYMVIEINPDNNTACYLLIRILMDRYELEEAEKLASYYIARFPANVFVYSALGRIYYIQGSPGAKEYLRNAKSYKSAYGDLSNALYNELLKKDDAAEKILETIIRQDPMLIEPHIALGRINLRKNKKLEAVSEFFTAGILLYKAKLYSEARVVFTKILAINDTIPEVYLYLGKSHEDAGNLALAVLYLKKAYALKPTMEVLIHIGYIYSLKNDFQESLKYFDRAIENEPENPGPYFFKGLLFSRKENFPQAELYIKKAIKLKEDNDTYHFYLATVLEKQNRLEETIQSLKNAIRFNPENAMAYNYLGYIYADHNMNIDEAITLIQKALEFSPSNGAYLDSLGWAYYRKGNFRLALENLLEAEKQLGKEKAEDPVVYDHIGDTYEKIGDRRRAVEYWKKSLDIQKDKKVEDKIKNSNGIDF